MSRAVARGRAGGEAGVAKIEQGISKPYVSRLPRSPAGKLSHDPGQRET